MGNIAPQFWDDDKVFSLPPAGVLLFNCMISGPQITNLPGLYRAAPSAFYHPLRCYPKDEVENAFEAILERGLAIFDAASNLLRLPKCYRHHPVPNANMIIGWRRTWDKLPNAQIKFDHLDSLWRLAKQKDAAAQAYLSSFGQIRPDIDPAEYRVSGWVNSRTVTRVETLPTIPSESEKKIDHIFDLGDPEEKTGTGTGTGTGTDTLLQPLQPSKPSEGLEGSEGLPQNEDLAANEHRTGQRASNGNGKRGRGAADRSLGAPGAPPGAQGRVPGGDPAGRRGSRVAIGTVPAQSNEPHIDHD